MTGGPRITLVRHGEAAAGFDGDLDPPLSEIGRAQAEAVADVLAGTGPVPMLCSPLRRTRETAAPLADRWSVDAAVEPAVGEVPTPTDDLVERTQWLRTAFSRSWDELEDGVRAWRDGVVARLLAVEGDTVVFTHFVAINAAVGAATGDDRFMHCAPGYCSRAVVTHDGATLGVIERPDEATTAVR